jgi:hypothetical protein
MTCLVIINPITCVLISVNKVICARSVPIVILELSLVLVAVGPSEQPIACFFVVNPITCVVISVGVTHFSFPVPLVILQLSLVVFAHCINRIEIYYSITENVMTRDS